VSVVRQEGRRSAVLRSSASFLTLGKSVMPGPPHIRIALNRLPGSWQGCQDSFPMGARNGRHGGISHAAGSYVLVRAVAVLWLLALCSACDDSGVPRSGRHPAEKDGVASAVDCDGIYDACIDHCGDSSNCETACDDAESTCSDRCDDIEDDDARDSCEDACDDAKSACEDGCQNNTACEDACDNARTACEEQ
jgi:hypothetical protein